MEKQPHLTTVDPQLSEHFGHQINSSHLNNWRSKFYLMHTTNAMNIINLAVRIIEGSDN